jgi:cell division septation protein DedD
MRRSSPRTSVIAFLFAAGLVGSPAALQGQATAQATPAPGLPRPANDSLFRRARTMVLEGNGAAGRALVDSLLAAATPGTAAYGDALYWHGALAPTIADAERDYRRVIVEYPLAYYADDALLAIAELEQARGDHAAALAHLPRFVHEHPASPARGIAALAAARLAFDQQHDTKIGCAMITEARASVGTTDVELTNQIAYFSARCPAAAPATVAKIGAVATKAATAVDTQSTATRSGVPRAEPDPLPATAATPTAPTTAPAPVAKPVTPPSRPAATATTAAAPATASAPTARRGRYTIQLAAYNTRPDAEAFIRKLATRGIKARVSGDAKPFRVRLDFYPTRSAAAAEVAALKARGIVGFVAEEAPPTLRAGQAPSP